MATEIFINIKDLPELTEIKNGDYIVIENATGTHIIDFQNFLIPTSNSVITTVVDQNTNGLIVLSAQSNTNSTSIATISSRVDTNEVKLNTLSASVIDNKIYIGKTQITIPQNSRQSSSPLTPVDPNVVISDIIITPANAYASKYPAYVSNYNTSNGNVTIIGSFHRNDVTTFSNNVSSCSVVDIPAEEIAIYNIVAIKNI